MQKKNRKGFTLIELLAVIVILAIIALIAVPVIMNVITKARKSAFEDSAYGIVKAGELYYSNQLLEPEGMTESKEFTIENGTFTSAEKLDVSGSLPSSGKVTVTSEGKVAIAISNGEYCIRKATTESSVKAEKLSDLGGVCNYKTVFTKASDGTEVPACIANNTECSAGTGVAVKVNNTDEPIDFYVVNDDIETGEITLIMNQNLGANDVAWVNKEDYLKAGGLEENWYTEASGRVTGNVNKGPLTALKTLEERTSSWTNIPSRTYQLKDEENSYPEITVTARARMLSNSEIIELGCNHAGSDCPAKLCSDRGDYWTSSATPKGDWLGGQLYYFEGITCTSYIGPYAAFDGYGIRPVITVSKTIL